MWPPSQVQRGVSSGQPWQMPSSQRRPQPLTQLQSGAAPHTLQGNLRRSSSTPASAASNIESDHSAVPELRLP